MELFPVYFGDWARGYPFIVGVFGRFMEGQGCAQRWALARWWAVCICVVVTSLGSHPHRIELVCSWVTIAAVAVHRPGIVPVGFLCGVHSRHDNYLILDPYGGRSRSGQGVLKALNNALEGKFMVVGCTSAYVSLFGGDCQGSVRLGHRSIALCPGLKSGE
jgi:hypothetical protein